MANGGAQLNVQENGAKTKISSPEQWNAQNSNTDGSWVEGASDGSMAAVYRDSSGAMVTGFANSVRAALALTANSYMLEQPGQFLVPETSGEVKTEDCGFVAELISDKEESPWAMRPLVEDCEPCSWPN